MRPMYKPLYIGPLYIAALYIVALNIMRLYIKALYIGALYIEPYIQCHYIRALHLGKKCWSLAKLLPLLLRCIVGKCKRPIASLTQVANRRLRTTMPV